MANTAKNGCQFYRLVATGQQIAKTRQYHQVATRVLKTSCCKIVCHLQTYYNLMKQVAASLWITSFENQLATSLLTDYNRLNSEGQQAVGSHANAS